MEKKRILVIDDEPELVKAIQIRLEQAGYGVLTAYDGMGGIARAREEKPDLIILDLIMPRMDGFEVCDRLRKDPETAFIPVVVLTAMEQEEAAKKALSAGAKGYMVKPLEQEILLFTVRKFLE